jgi:hypothetical protein
MVGIHGLYLSQDMYDTCSLNKVMNIPIPLKMQNSLHDYQPLKE